MDKMSMVLVGLMALVLAFLMAPRVIEMNRGKTLQNIALWLAIFLGLALAYRLMHPVEGDFGPQDETMPSAIQSLAPSNAEPLIDPYAKDSGETATPQAEGASDEEAQPTGTFTPPGD